jgi:TRAP-type mannitol/chloroaromatic compound transport system permease small subunit
MPLASLEWVLSRSQDKGSDAMKALLTISRAIDAINERVGRLLLWLVLIVVLVSAANATSRYLLNLASNAWLELQWYLFAAIFLGCAGYTLLHNEHIRIDVISSRLSRRTQLWIDILGTVFFLLPVTLYIMWLSWPIFMNAWTSGEVSNNAGGLIRWPARFMVPAGFFLLSLQGVSELIKRIAVLRGLIPDQMEHHADAALEIIQPDDGEPR